MKKKIFSAVLLISAMALQSVNAAYVTDKKPDTNGLTVEGTVEEAKLNRLLNVTVVKDVYDWTAYPNGILYGAVIDTDANGDFKHEFVLDMDSVSENEHDFKLYISAYGSDKTIEEKFIYYSATEIKKILSKIADETTSDNVKLLIEANTEPLNITTDLFTSLSPEDKEVIYGEIAKETEFSSVSDFEDVFYSCVLARVLANAESADESEKAFAKLSGYTQISELGIYGLFEKLSDKTAVYKRMCKAQVKNNEEICNMFTEQTVLAILENTQNANEAKSIIASGGKTFAEDYARIEQCTYPGAVYTELSGKSFSDKLAFQNGVTELINRYGSGSVVGGSTVSGTSGAKDKRNDGVTTSAAVVSGTNKQESDIFTDLSEAEWAEDSIKAMYEKKIVSGYPDGSFRPNNPITREEFISLTVSAYSISGGDGADFADVPSGAWYEKAVNAAAEAGIVSGIGENMFGVGKYITREEAAAIIKRTADKLGIELEKTENVSFSDYDDIAEFAKAAATDLAAAKIISGYPDGGFHPKDLLTRAQCCVILKNMSEKGVYNG